MDLRKSLLADIFRWKRIYGEDKEAKLLLPRMSYYRLLCEAKDVKVDAKGVHFWHGVELVSTDRGSPIVVSRRSS